MTDAERFRDAIRRLRIELQIVNDEIAAAEGLHPRDLDVLDVIDREGPSTPSHLAARTGQRRATLTGVLARLERDGWIARTGNPVDGRSAHVRSTARFERLRERYASVTAGAEALVEHLDPRERALVEDVLSRLVERLRSRDGAERG